MSDKTARIVFSKNRAVLLEYLDDANKPVRVSIPENMVQPSSDGKTAVVSEDILSMGAPYGVQFAAEIGDITISGKSIEDSLHSSGIWTCEDVIHSPQDVNSAVMAAASHIFKTINVLVRSHFSKEA